MLDRNTVVAIICAVAFYIGYEFYLNQKYPDRFKPPVATQTKTAAATRGGAAEISSAAATPSAAAAPAASEEPAPKVEITIAASDLVMETPEVRWEFASDHPGIRQVTLKDYRNDAQTGPLTLLQRPLQVEAEDASGTVLQAVSRRGRAIDYVYHQGPWQVTQTFSVPEAGYGVNLHLEWKNRSQAASELSAGVLFREHLVTGQEASGSFLPGVILARPSVVTSIDGKASWEFTSSLCEAGSSPFTSELPQDVDFVGFDQHYFLMAFLPDAKRVRYGYEGRGLADGSCRVSVRNRVAFGSLKPGESRSLAYGGWFGPKLTEPMTAYNPRLAEAIDLGFFGMISRGLFIILKMLYAMVHNWGIAIILCTVLIKVAFYPLTKKSMESMRRMSKLQPEMTRLREKYKDDPKAQQQALMAFMSQNKINPMKGCLPVLLQIPVFFAFYRVLSSAVELRQAPFFGWISDLSLADPFYIMPILIGVCFFAQQRLTPNAGLDKAQERIMAMIPILFTVMMLTLPAGLGLYMLANSFVSILQQQWLNKRLA